jgi:integrase/recombinase XerD
LAVSREGNTTTIKGAATVEENGQTSYNNNIITVNEDDVIYERKIQSITEDLTPHITNLLSQQSKENALTIANYILTMKTEINLSRHHKENQIQTLCYLSRYHQNKKIPFTKMTRDDILEYLDTHRKPEDVDPQHKWMGSYNLRRSYFLRFFKWLYFPDLHPDKRPVPDVMKNIPQLKRKEVSTIKPSDLWTEEDDQLFLKYCGNKRDKAYHTIARDSSCRPGEILNLRIRDLKFMISEDKKQYAQILVNGKTGSRHLPLFSALPYVKDWLDSHPLGTVPKAHLIPSLDVRHRKYGHRMQTMSLNNIYRHYKQKYFPALLESPAVPPEDKLNIKELLKKPWNPYIRRHSALTQKAQLLKEPLLKAYAGWSQSSQMNLKYEHWFGNESSDTLLQAYGMSIGSSAKNKPLSDTLKPKQCPNCNESNIPDSKFCSKCRMVLTYDAYEETLEEQKNKDKRLEELEKNIQLQQKSQLVQQQMLELIMKTIGTEYGKVLQEQMLSDSLEFSKAVSDVKLDGGTSSPLKNKKYSKEEISQLKSKLLTVKFASGKLNDSITKVHNTMIQEQEKQEYEDGQYEEAAAEQNRYKNK